MLFLIQANKTVSAGGWTANRQAPTFFVEALNAEAAVRKASDIMQDSRPGATFSTFATPVLPEVLEGWAEQ